MNRKFKDQCLYWNKKSFCNNIHYTIQKLGVIIIIIIFFFLGGGGGG